MSTTVVQYLLYKSSSCYDARLADVVHSLHAYEYMAARVQ